MAGQLIQVNTATVTVATPSVTLTGIDSDDVYMLAVSNCTPVTNGVNGELRVTKSGTQQSDINYDFAFKGLRTDTTFSNLSSTGSSKWTYPVGWSQSNTATEAGVTGNAIIYLYNFNSSSEYSFITVETATKYSGGILAPIGGAVHKVASASDGIHFQWSTGNIASGTFTLFRCL